MQPTSPRLLLFLLCAIFWFAPSTAQQQKSDSLLIQLDNHPRKDSIRATTLVDLSTSVMYQQPQEALDYASEALLISDRIDWPKGKAEAYRQKGNVYYIMADDVRAMQAFQEAMTLSRKMNDDIMEASIYNNLGNIYADMKENDRALENYEAFLRKAKQLENATDQVKALTNMGIVYNDMNEHDKGISYLQKALAIAKKEKNAFFEAAIINNLGLAYKDKKDYSSSLSYYSEAVSRARAIENSYIEASALNSIGKVNLLMENYEAAEQSASKALAIAKKIETVEWQADAWQVLSEVYENQEKTTAAFSAYKNHVKLKDSVIGEEKKSEITRKEMQFQLERQEEEAKVTLGKEKTIRNLAIGGGILACFIAMMGYFLYKKRRDAIEQKRVAEFKTKVAETELKALRSQMNPHFIFNALNSISDYMGKNDVETANTYLMKFAKLTRSILENSEKKWITLQEDLELTELYMEIEAFRLKNKLSYNIVVDEALDVENTLVPPMLLQPFIENSIWHGIAAKEGRGTIDLSIRKENEIVVCTVDDDGVGRKNNDENPMEKTSMGVKITKNRLAIISKLKKVKGSVEMFDKTQGLRVELKLPLELRF